MRSRARSSLLALALFVSLASGCARNVARVAREWSPGPVRVDRERSISVERINADSVAVGLPLLGDGGDTASGIPTFVGSCTVRAAQIFGAQRDSVLDLDDAGLQTLFAATTFSSVGASRVSFSDDGTRPARVYFAAQLPEDPDPGDTPADDRSLLLEVWADPDEVTANACATPVPSPRAEAMSRYLLDFEIARPITGVAMSGGAYIIAAVGLTTLVALAFGG